MAPSTIAHVDPVSYAFEDRLILLDGLAIELFAQFAQFAEGSTRLPLVWLMVRFDERKDDKLRVHLGTGPAGGPFYSDDARALSALGQFDVPSTELPRLREFFDEAARRAGRAA